MGYAAAPKGYNADVLAVAFSLNGPTGPIKKILSTLVSSDSKWWGNGVQVEKVYLNSYASTFFNDMVKGTNG